MTLVNQPTAKTARKVKASAWTAAWVSPASILLGGIAVGYLPASAAEYIAEVQLLFSFAITGVGTWIVGYWTKERA